jgi:hypothetical protein
MGHTFMRDRTGKPPMKSIILATGFVFVILQASPVRADPQECQEALNTYNSAISDLSQALKIYSECLSDSQGHDDCSMQFATLQTAQDSFSTAVSGYQASCR